MKRAPAAAAGAAALRRQEKSKVAPAAAAAFARPTPAKPAQKKPAAKRKRRPVGKPHFAREGDSDSEEEVHNSYEDEDDDEFEPAAKKRAAAKKPGKEQQPAAKKKPAAGSKKKKPAAAGKRQAAASEEYDMVEEEGDDLLVPGAAGGFWMFTPGPPFAVIWGNLGAVKPSTKIVAVALDGGLLAPRPTGRKHPRDENDYIIWNTTKMPGVLTTMVADGYKLVAFGNSHNIKKAYSGKGIQNVTGMVASLQRYLSARCGVEVPLQVFLSPQPDDDAALPGRAMWDFMAHSCNGGVKVDPAQSYFIGDGESSREFAKSVGITYRNTFVVFGAKPAPPPRPSKSKPPPPATLSKEASKARRAAGDNPNDDLLAQFAALARRSFKASKARRDGELRWKAIAYQNARKSLAAFPDFITLENYKQLAGLPGVGKSTMQRVKSYLESGSIAKAGDVEPTESDDESDEGEDGGSDGDSDDGL